MKKLIDAVLQLFYPIFKPFMSFSVYAYLSLGAVNTVLNIALFALFYQVILAQDEYFLGQMSIKSYTVALIIAFLLTIPTGYWLAKNFAFKSENKQDDKTSMLKYILVVTQGLISDYLLMKLLIEFFSVQPTLAKIVSTVIVLTANYLLQKYFTFKAK